MARQFKTAALIGFLVVLPFMLLEVANRQNLNTEFPGVLFVVMWLLAALFTAGVLSLVQTRRGVAFVPRIVLVILIALFWIGLVADQMPCFLGVPNCD